MNPGISRAAYDAVIIGAGIGGLVCGCYLSRAGLKVLIAEQHSKPGGYCSSFKRKNFVFDAAAHSFGGYKNGPLGSIFRELGVDKKIKLRRFDPSDTIIAPTMTVRFWADVNKTIEEFQSAYPGEKKIKEFFHFILDPDPMAFIRMRSLTFKDLLDKYFIDHKIKAVLSFPLFGNCGLPSSLTSAFIGAKIFKEFLLDGGYYPEGGMQNLSRALAEIFQEAGGELWLSCLIKKIAIKDNKVIGIVSEKDGFIQSTSVISNCDARQTFFKLLGKKNIGENFCEKINNMTPSLSTFVVYLGIDKNFNNLPQHTNLWHLSDYDVDKIYLSSAKGDLRHINNYLVHSRPDDKIISGYIMVPSKTNFFWKTQKEKLLDYFIDTIEKHFIPFLSKHISHKEAATPNTLNRYTLNYRGAAFGWACIPSQFADSDFRKPHVISGLYLTGHWTTEGLGIPGVTYLGYDTANLILKKRKTRFKNLCK
jgi:phytoene dehydrogenase-like protein